MIAADMATPTALERWRREIDDEIGRIITDLERNGPEHDDVLMQRVYRWMRHYLDFGGRRIHGIVVILAHLACSSEPSPAIVQVAAAIQLYHHHTLVHDDIYDEDRFRRGWPTSHMAFADMFTARCGDIGINGAPGTLFAREDLRRGTISAFAYGKICRALASHTLLRSPFDVAARAEAAALLDWHDLYDNAAQLKDVANEGSAMPSAMECLANAWLKTGRLYEVCAAIGGQLAGATPAQHAALKTWAGQSAISYQLADDLEDLNVKSEKGQGRGIASDLLRRKGTYLFAIAKEIVTGNDLTLLTEWQSGIDTDATPEDIVEILHRCGAVAACRTEIERAVGRSIAALGDPGLGFDPKVVEDMIGLSHYSVSPAYWHRPIVNDPGRAAELLS